MMGELRNDCIVLFLCTNYLLLSKTAAFTLHITGRVKLT